MKQFMKLHITNTKRRISVSGVLKHLGVSKSGYYDWLDREPSNRSKQKELIKAEIRKIYDESFCIYGAPKITKELHKKGFKTAESTVTRYMRGLIQSRLTARTSQMSSGIYSTGTFLLKSQMPSGAQTLHISIPERALLISLASWICSPGRSSPGNWLQLLKQAML